MSHAARSTPGKSKQLHTHVPGGIAARACTQRIFLRRLVPRHVPARLRTIRYMSYFSGTSRNKEKTNKDCEQHIFRYRLTNLF
eukprot:4766919-Amphidinium_carterae.1